VTVSTGTDANTLRLRLPGEAEDIRAALTKGLPDREGDVERADSVGPKVGGNLRTAGIISIVLSIAIHVVYIGLRFDLAFAPGAIACLFHDVAITCGILVLTRQEFGLQTVSALLTLTGYSLNDTIVIYDRIRENMGKFRRKDFGELINVSMNETLSRTIMTSLSTSMAMIPFLFIGGPVLREFATVMLIGIVIGTYSSIYVAVPITMLLEDHKDQILSFLGFGKKSAKGTAGPALPHPAAKDEAP
jgi:preprotein translocase subunit SecF